MNSQINLQSIKAQEFEKALDKVEDFVSQGVQSGVASGKKALIVGDVGLDKYLYGDVGRISPEAPVPVVNLQSTESKLGLSANVAKNFASLGGRCDLLGVRGADAAGLEIEAYIEKIEGLESKIMVSKTRPTTEKTRILSGQHHLLRLDAESAEDLSEVEKQSFSKALSDLNFNDYGFVILEDYGKGVLGEDFCQSLIQKAKQAHVQVLVDPSKKASLKKFRGADFFKPNFNETLSYAERAGTESYTDLLQWILKEGDFKNLVSTLGSQGMSLTSSEKMIKVPTFAKKVFDVTGAGDTVIASLTFGLSHGLSVEEACLFSNFAAGFVVSKVGAVSCTLKDVQEQILKTPREELLKKL